jgi:hypothetical protein
VSIQARNAIGTSPATSSAVVYPNHWTPVELREHGGWTRHLNAGNDESRTVWSRETGQAEGLCLNRDVLAGDDPPTTESYDDRVEDRFLEGDEWLLYLPFFFSLSEGWSSPLGSDSRVMALTDGTATNVPENPGPYQHLRPERISSRSLAAS